MDCVEHFCDCLFLDSLVNILQENRNFMPPRHRPAGGIERSGCPYVRTYVRPSEDQVEIFVKGRISRTINGIKLIFHRRMYLYLSRNLQEP